MSKYYTNSLGLQGSPRPHHKVGADSGSEAIVLPCSRLTDGRCLNQIVSERRFKEKSPSRPFMALGCFSFFEEK
jgi:hypothetical protein